MPESTVEQLLSRHLWRVLLIALAVGLAVFAWHDTLVAVIAVVPVLISCLGRSQGTGLAVGLTLVALAAWILVPRGLGLSGGGVPSVYEVCLALPIISAFVCALGMRAERSGSWLATIGLAALIVVGFFAAGFKVLDYSEGTPGAEGVWPGPSGLRVVELTPGCGSGGCTRSMEATGDRAAQRMRDYLDSRGFTTPAEYEGWTCQVTGLVLTYRVCATVKEVTPDMARVSWDI